MTVPSPHPDPAPSPHPDLSRPPSSPRPARRTVLGAAGLTAVGLSSCGPAAQDSENPPLRIHANDITVYQPNFNPYSPTALQGASGLIFEPLMVYTAMDPDKPVPWVAEKITFGDDGTSAEILVREGIVFTDDHPLTAEDVEYSLLMLRDKPATNGSALPVKDAKRTGERTVEVSFEGPSFAHAPTLGGSYVVPKHIFENLDVEKDAIAEPVGSGPYMLDRFSDQLYTFRRNEKHWAVGDFEVPELYYPSYSTETFNTALQAGEIDWSGGFVANVDKIFVAKDPEHRGYYYPGLGVVNLTFNLEKDLWQDLELRRGISLAIDRTQIADIAMLGYVGPPHPTALPRPTFEQYIARRYQGKEFEFDPDKAEKVLDDAGYRRGADGVRAAEDGTKLEFPLQIPSGFVDWVSVTQVLNEQLQKIGVRFTPQGVSMESWTEKRNAGSFDVTLSTVSAGASPWFMYRSMLSSEHRSKDGTVLANFQRWYDDDTDELLSAFTATDDEAEQQRCIDGLEDVVVEKLPALPLVTAPNWFNYNTESWSGFPDPDHPYALGAPYSPIDRILVLRELTRTTD
ncbi:ABC transporter substrate-binding protein [Brachybacterium sp. NPDC056505]|uniref:ABC transporter substrate-binding protein n=1 Tax=Brachybacterium sp. NPDC056505 TaxID=3345843 RepID=UPI00366D6EB1